MNTIDWELIHKRLADNQRIIEMKWKSKEEVSTLLRERADKLSQEIMENETEELDSVNIIGFMMNSEHYGALSSQVALVRKANGISYLPNAPSFVEGMMNIHGRIVCVVNLKVLLGLNGESISESSHVLMVEHDDIILGILVDSVTGVDKIITCELQTSLPALHGINSEFLIGISKEQVIILNLKSLAAHHELIINEYV